MPLNELTISEAKEKLRKKETDAAGLAEACFTAIETGGGLKQAGAAKSPAAIKPAAKKTAASAESEPSAKKPASKKKTASAASEAPAKKPRSGCKTRKTNGAS